MGVQIDRLNLFSAPSSISFPHVLWWFDRRNKLQGDIRDTDYANSRSKDFVQGVIAKEDRASEDVDYPPLACIPVRFVRVDLTDSATNEREKERSIS